MFHLLDFKFTVELIFPIVLGGEASLINEPKKRIKLDKLNFKEPKSSLMMKIENLSIVFKLSLLREA